MSYINLALLSFVLTKGATAYSNSNFGRGNGGIFLDDVRCTGTESRLINCRHSGVGVHNCDHSDDAGVRCTGIIMYISILQYAYYA